MSSEPKCNLADLQPVKFSGTQTLALGTLPSVQYGIISERLRQTSSKNFHCHVFCPGKRCRFEGPKHWQNEDMSIMGTFSTWITDEIVTMARPSTAIIEKYKIIKQFHEIGIKSLINLQQRGEHSSCGVRLEKSGFTYDPQVFMENKIFYYNFDWRDYGAVPKTALLDMVKVLTFALAEGKVAIHSHSGLGRTGVLVACYLIYTMRCKPTDAVDFVRNKRPGSVPTKSQVESVQGFAQFVVPMFIVFANVIPRDDYRMSLNMYLRRQRCLLHGFEGRLLKHVPKPVFIFCERLLSLTDTSRHKLGADRSLDLDHLFDDPNQFLAFCSSRCRLLNVRFDKSSKFSERPKDKWVHIPKPYMNGIAEEPRHCAPPSPPNGVVEEGDQKAVWDSPDSQSCHEEPENGPVIVNQVDGCPPQGEDADFDLSGDEETAKPEPEMEYSNSKSLSNTESSTDVVNGNGAPQMVNENEEAEADQLNGNVDVFPDAGPNDFDQDDVDEEDPLDDLNSEECNAIIDSVLQESPSEHNMSYVLTQSMRKKDIFASKDSKGCSTLSIEEECFKPLSNSTVIEALLTDQDTGDTEFAQKLRRYQRSLNNRGASWENVAQETDPAILSALLWSWLDQLREPVLNINDLSTIVIRSDKTMDILKRLDNGTRYTTEYLVRFVYRLQPKTPELKSELLRRLVASLTHQTVGVRGTLRPRGKEWNKLRPATTQELLTFIGMLYDMAAVEDGNKLQEATRKR